MMGRKGQGSPRYLGCMTPESADFDVHAETLEVLADPEAMAALADTEPVVFGMDAIRQVVVERRRRSSRRTPR